MSFIKNPDKETSIQLLKKIVTRHVTTAPRKIDKPLALYGAGDLGQMAKKYFDRIGIEVKFIVDIHADVWRKKNCWKGTQILFPEEVSVDQKNRYLLAVCIVTIPYTPLSDNLFNQGWKDIVPFYDIAEAYREYHPLSNGWFANPVDTIDMYNISDILNMWSDDISRAHHLQFIAWRLHREELVFEKAQVNIKNRFFIQEVKNVLTDHELFADIGAHHGMVTEKFIDIIEGNFEKIWMIEPDPINLKKLHIFCSNKKQDHRSKIKIIPRVIGESSQKKYFYEGLGYASQLSNLGSTRVETTTIDDLSITPTFIKLHLEGGELDALKGSKDTILKHRPIIALTIYHNDDGIWKTAKWMQDNIIDYNFYMRLHSWCGTGAVLYSIPKERG